MHDLMKIYFFTGTGNSYLSASHLVSRARESGKKAEVVAIDKLERKDISPGVEGSITGFFYPTHGFSLPWYMLRFILFYPRGRGKIFLVNSRAGMKMSRFFTPGLSGIAVHLPMLILLLKGYSIAGTLPLDTPSNWISVHPGLKSRVVKSIFDRRTRDLDRLWTHILNGRRFFPLKYILFIPLDILVLPIGIGYMLFGRFVLARSYFPDEKCDGCGICATRCPAGAIEMKNGMPYWTYRCESCMRCSNVCPHRSVNSSVPFMILATWGLLRLSSYTGPLKPFWSALDSITGVADPIVYYSVLWIFTMIGSYILYNLFNLLNRLPWFRLLLSRTTPMFWWRRYIAPGFKGKYYNSGESLSL